MTVAVHQFVPSLAPRDAIGTHTLATREVLLELGLHSEIFADEVRPGMEGRAKPYRSYGRALGRSRRGGRSYLLYQGSIGSPVADFLAARPEPKWVYFHNITPRRLVEAWEPEVGMAAATGWSQLCGLAPGTSASFAASDFNREELVRCGFAGPVVVPPLVELGSCPPDQATLDRLGTTRRGAELLFVGRVSPHKAQHHLVAALAAYRRAYDPGARLHLVGGSACDPFRDALVRYAATLGLADVVDVAGSVGPGELAAHYRHADVFACASSHEGFCVPLLEAMAYGLPIVAYAAGAVPDTVGGAGLMLHDREPAFMAAAIHRVLTDPVLRASTDLGAKAQLARFDPARTRSAMADAVRAALSAG